jgi:hypothetical protein
MGGLSHPARVDPRVLCLGPFFSVVGEIGDFMPNAL